MYTILDTNFHDIKKNIGRLARFYKILPSNSIHTWDNVPESIFKNQIPIRSWKMFAREVRNKDKKLLSRLDEFPFSVLVTGCQRSGTTMLTRLITNSEGMAHYWFGHDDELATALILCGYVEHQPVGRYCFQTTYVNECYDEYLTHHNGHKIIWLLRNPYSVIYSMLHNWSRSSMNELFLSCGETYSGEIEKFNLHHQRWRTISPVIRACLAYNGKVSQLFELRRQLGPQNIMVASYDDLLMNKYSLLPLIYGFIGLKYQTHYADRIYTSANQKAKRQNNKEQQTVEKLCLSTYYKAKYLIDSNT